MTGMSEARKPTLSGVIYAPPASVVRRKVPATMGMNARAINAIGRSQSATAFNIAESERAARGRYYRLSILGRGSAQPSVMPRNSWARAVTAVSTGKRSMEEAP